MMIVSGLVGAAAVLCLQRRYDVLCMSGVVILLGLMTLQDTSRRNTRVLTVSEVGVDALLNDGRKVHIPWRDVIPGEIRGGSLKTINGLTLRFNPSPDLQAAIRAARRKTGGFAATRRSMYRLFGRLFVLSVCTSVLCGAAGVLAIYLAHPAPGFTPSPTRILALSGVLEPSWAGILPFGVWIHSVGDRWVFPTRVKLYSSAPRASSEPPPASPNPVE